jgi:regulatory protein
MKITAFKQQIKNPGRVSVFVDEKYSFSLTLDQLADSKLKNGDELDAAKLKKLNKLSIDGKLRARALEWLLNRPHSEREFTDYMYRKKADPELTQKLAGEFISKGYLSNENYAKWLVDLRQRKGKSNRAIQSELSSKGVSREVAAEVLSEHNNEDERLKILIEKKKANSRYKNDQLKFIKYLTSQGFSYSDVKRRLNEDEESN